MQAQRIPSKHQRKRWECYKLSRVPHNLRLPNCCQIKSQLHQEPRRKDKLCLFVLVKPLRHSVVDDANPNPNQTWMERCCHSWRR
ncbi:hypothetical protein AB205_0102990 [Aquarana catesbeiana]|uniref:Uncharacterized protein n=1 Tax=Aquarana catesbeiana TaxID=8400 RepID=A0A2G9RAT0_AQUCT|nr:hypothetical protein AB205_0102990 [Aquarana catesbeiana]